MQVQSTEQVVAMVFIHVEICGDQDREPGPSPHTHNHTPEYKMIALLTRRHGFVFGCHSDPWYFNQ